MFMCSAQATRLNAQAQTLNLKHWFAVVSATAERLRMRRDSTDNLADTDL